MNRRDRVEKNHRFTGAGKFGRVFGGKPDQPNGLACAFDHRRPSQLARKQRFCGNVSIRHQDRKIDLVHEPGKHLRSVVKFVVSDCHPVIAKHIHHLGCHLTLVARVKQRSLKLVPPVDEHEVGASRFRVLDCVHQTGGASKAVTRRVILGRARTVVFADRFEPRVEIIGVQNCQVKVSRCRAGRQRKNRGGRKESFHGHLPRLKV